MYVTKLCICIFGIFLYNKKLKFISYWCGEETREVEQISPHIVACNNRSFNYRHYWIREFEIFLYNKDEETLLIIMVP